MSYTLCSFLIWTFGVNYITVSGNQSPSLNFYLTLPLENSAFTLKDLVLRSSDTFAEKFDEEKLAYENLMRTSAEHANEEKDETDEIANQIKAAVKNLVLNKTLGILGKVSEIINPDLIKKVLPMRESSNKLDPKVVFNIVVNRKPSDGNYHSNSNDDTNQKALKEWEEYLKSYERKGTKITQTKFDKDMERLLSKMIRLRSNVPE